MLTHVRAVFALSALLVATASADHSPALGAPLLSVTSGGITRVVYAWGSDSLRILAVHAGADPTKALAPQQTQALLATPPAPTPTASPTTADGLTATNGNIVVSFAAAADDGDGDGEEGAFGPSTTASAAAAPPLATITRRSDGKVLLRETSIELAPLPLTDAVRRGGGVLRPLTTGGVTFSGLAQGEGVYGLGEHRGTERCTNQCLNTSLPIREWSWRIQDSINITKLPNNGNAWIPYYACSRGFGFLWNSASYGDFSVGRDAIRWTSVATRALDYFVTTTAASTSSESPPYRDLQRNYARATGLPPKVPHDYTGFWQCKLRYSSQAQVLRVASEYTRRGLPLSVIVVDYHHWVHNGDW